MLFIFQRLLEEVGNAVPGIYTGRYRVLLVI